MAQATPEPRSRPLLRRFAPRFSLAAALVAMTLCSVGLWYWYRVPFEVVHDRASSVSSRVHEGKYREVETVRRTWDGTVRHGTRRVFINDKLRFVENYRDGAPHGKWEWLDGTGQAAITAEFRLGRLESFDASPQCDQRLARLLAEGAMEPRFARALLQDTEAEFIETPLKDALVVLRDMHDVPIELYPMLSVSDFSIDMPITCQAQGPLIQVLGQMLQPRDLVCDYRYGMLYVTEREGVENWQDPTGVSEIIPPPGSKLAATWEESTTMEFIETPLRDALRIVANMHNVNFDTSRAPDSIVNSNRITVTFNVSGPPFKHCLGALLDRIDCQASLDGETIVIDLQPDHPLAEKR